MEFCHSIQLSFFLLDKIDSLSDDNLYKIKEVEEALQQNDPTIVSVQGDTWMSSSKLTHIRSTFWNDLFSIDKDSILQYIESVVKEWPELGINLQLPISTLKTIEANYPGDTYRQKVEIIATWLISSHFPPPCWWSLVKALQNIEENTSAKAIVEDHGN